VLISKHFNLKLVFISLEINLYLGFHKKKMIYVKIPF